VIPSVRQVDPVRSLRSIGYPLRYTIWTIPDCPPQTLHGRDSQSLYRASAWEPLGQANCTDEEPTGYSNHNRAGWSRHHACVSRIASPPAIALPAT
jgi:hypothetical protein